MNGYQPAKKCTNCLVFDVCNKKHKNKVCKNYKAYPPPPPPKSGSLAITPKGIIYTPPQKQRTVLSVRDFAILYNLVSNKVQQCEIYAEDAAQTYLEGMSDQSLGRLFYVDEAKKKRFLEENHEYQDLLRIRDKLGELNIEVETPIVEVEE